MEIIVQKYGGTSVGSIAKIKKIALNIKKLKNKKTAPVVIVSAMAGETNKLIKLVNSISSLPNEREYDQILREARLDPVEVRSRGVEVLEI